MVRRLLIPGWMTAICWGSDAGPPGGYPPFHSNQPPGGPHVEPSIGARGSFGWYDRENAVTGTSFHSATGALSVFGGEGALASANEVPVTAFSLALRSTRRPLSNHPDEPRAPTRQ